ncbi:MAG TPA: DUF445 family protein, partial [Gemmatimonadales bacterium]|nr:DUF445 family protein [Gemmatimonadales bacterium]
IPMDSQTLVSGLVTIGVGTISGGITNAVAIWMLFNPHEPFRLGPFRLHGALPKNKERLAKAIGRTVGQKLLTPEDLAQRLSAPPIREAFSRALEGGIGRFLREDRGPLIDLLTPEVRARLEEALDGLARRGGDALMTYAGSPEFEARVAELLPLVAEQFGSILADPSAKEEVKTALRGTLEKSLPAMRLHERLAAKLVITESAIDRFLDSLNIALTRVPPAERLERMDPERRTALARRVADWLVKLSRDRGLAEEGIRSLAKALLDRPIGRPVEWLGEENADALTRAIVNESWSWVQSQVPGVVGELDIPGMVEQKVMGLSTQKMEELVRTVTERELQTIVNLGYVLGAIVGAL